MDRGDDDTGDETPERGMYLPGDAFAVAYHPEKGYSVYMPTGLEEGKQLPDPAVALVTCAGRLANDPEFVREMVAWAENLKNQIEEKEQSEGKFSINVQKP